MVEICFRGRRADRPQPAPGRIPWMKWSIWRTGRDCQQEKWKRGIGDEDPSGAPRGLRDYRARRLRFLAVHGVGAEGDDRHPVPHVRRDVAPEDEGDDDRPAPASRVSAMWLSKLSLSSSTEAIPRPRTRFIDFPSPWP